MTFLAEFLLRVAHARAEGTLRRIRDTALDDPDPLLRPARTSYHQRRGGQPLRAKNEGLTTPMMRRYRALTRATRILVEATECEESLLLKLMQTGAEAFQSYCGLALVPENGDGNRLELSVGFDADADALTTLRAAWRRLKPSTSVPRFLSEPLRTGRSLLLGELEVAELAELVAPEQREKVLQLRICSAVCAPLRSHERTVGVLTLLRHGHAAPPFEPVDQLAAENLADHVTLALDNLHAHAAQRRAADARQGMSDRIHLLSDTAQTFAGATGDYQQLLALVARRLSDVVGDLCVIRLLDAGGAQLETTGATYHPDPNVLAAVREALLSAPQQLGEGLAGKVALSGEALLIPVITPDQLAAQTRPEYRTAIELLNVHSLIIAPLMSRGRPVGVINLARSHPARPYTRDDLLLVQELAAHAALAIDNARLIASERSARSLAERELVERDRLEQALHETEKVLDAAPDAMVIVDADGRIRIVNAQLESTFGYRREELLGQPVEVLVPARCRARHPGHRAGYFHDSRPRPMGSGLELTGLRRDGSEFPAEISLAPLRTPDGLLVTAAIRDVTERKLLENRMHAAFRYKNEFLANMSHELRTPLNGIIGFSEVIRDGKAGPLSNAQHEYLGDILTSSNHLLQLINDILDLSKIESGTMEFRATSFDLAHLVAEVRSTLRGLAKEKRLRFETHLDPNLGPLHLDPARLKQVLYNYLSNAIKFTPERGRVTLRISPEPPDHFRIEVEDTGIGIARADIDKLFIAFQQLDASAAKKYPGTGLGLALTRRIVEAQSGRVEVRSVLGQGSTFVAVLPRVVQTS